MLLGCPGAKSIRSFSSLPARTCSRHRHARTWPQRAGTRTSAHQPPRLCLNAGLDASFEEARERQAMREWWERRPDATHEGTHRGTTDERRYSSGGPRRGGMTLVRASCGPVRATLLPVLSGLERQTSPDVDEAD